MRSESFRKGVKDGIPIGLGYFAVSFTFGMMAVADGLSIWQAVLISLTNVTSAGKELMSRDELSVMDGNKCILQLRGVRPFLSDKFDITKHKRYRELSDYDEKNAFDVEAYMKHQLKIRRQEEFDLYEVDGNEAEEHETEKTVN